MSDPADKSVTPAEDVLGYRGKVFVNFLNATYQWVDIKLSSLPTEALNDRGVLGLLLRHVRYRDTYATAKEEDAVDILVLIGWMRSMSIRSRRWIRGARRRRSVRGPNSGRRSLIRFATNLTRSCIAGFAAQAPCTS